MFSNNVCINKDIFHDEMTTAGNLLSNDFDFRKVSPQKEASFEVQLDLNEKYALSRDIKTSTLSIVHLQSISISPKQPKVKTFNLVKSKTKFVVVESLSSDIETNSIKNCSSDVQIIESPEVIEISETMNILNNNTNTSWCLDVSQVPLMVTSKVESSPLKNHRRDCVECDRFIQGFQHLTHNEKMKMITRCQQKLKGWAWGQFSYYEKVSLAYMHERCMHFGNSE